MNIPNRPRQWLLNDISEENREFIFEEAANQDVRVGVLVNSILSNYKLEKETIKNIDRKPALMMKSPLKLFGIPIRRNA
jgi:hypothetical protein